MGFEKQYSLLHRKNESSRVIAKYPDRCPVICERGDKSIVKIDKIKYLVPMDITMGQFMYVIRKRIKLPPEQAMFFYVNKSMVCSSVTMQYAYEKYKSDDGFLYIKYTGENTFGFI